MTSLFRLIAMMIMLCPAFLFGADLEVRFCPVGNVWSYPAESQRGVQSVLLQNAAIVNRATEPIEITAAPIASGWSEPSSRAGLSPAVDQRLFTAHA